MKGDSQGLPKLRMASYLAFEALPRSLRGGLVPVRVDPIEPVVPLSYEVEVCGLLTPEPWMIGEWPDYSMSYLQMLDRLGAGRVADELAAISERHDGKAICLLDHDRPIRNGHGDTTPRVAFAHWWEGARGPGEAVLELLPDGTAVHPADFPKRVRPVEPKDPRKDRRWRDAPDVPWPPTDDDVLRWIGAAHWQQAKSAHNPHQYNVRHWGPELPFWRVVVWIRETGRTEVWGGQTYRHKRIGDHKYWTQGHSLASTIILNRKEWGRDPGDRDEAGEAARVREAPEPVEAATSGLLCPEARGRLDPDGTYGLWTFNTKRRKKWKERGPDYETRTRYSVEPRPREEWQAVAVDLSGSGLSRAHVDAARERVKGNTRRPASTVSERFWQLSGGVARCEICGSALSPHTTSRAGGRKAPYYRCFQRYNSGPRDCTNTKTLPAAPLEEAVWQRVRLLLEEPERVVAAYDAYLERRVRQLRGDPDREARDLSARLEKLERRRSNLIDMGADGTIGREDLRLKLAEADEERDSLRRALREAAGRGEELKRLRKEREVLAGRFRTMRGMGLRHLPPEGRRAVYEGLRLTAHVDEKGDAQITGIFDADITELLPGSWADAKAAARHHDLSLNTRLPILHKGVVSAGRPRRGT